jgi:hypothetical protein
MELADEINKAIGAHAMWKQRLRQAIDSSGSEFTVERVRPDNLCDFGKWLYSLSITDQQSTHWKTVKELHAKFHIEAARVLDLALKGKKQEAEKALNLGSDFAKASADLTTAMMKWKSATS